MIANTNADTARMTRPIGFAAMIALNTAIAPPAALIDAASLTKKTTA